MLATWPAELWKKLFSFYTRLLPDTTWCHLLLDVWYQTGIISYSLGGSVAAYPLLFLPFFSRLIAQLGFHYCL